jgi:hypothetical protein
MNAFSWVVGLAFPEEQLRRFQERRHVGYKRYKLTEEDWRNRDKWLAYEAAACDMLERTSTEIAKWTLVAAEDKLHARIRVIASLCEGLEAVLGPDVRPAPVQKPKRRSRAKHERRAKDRSGRT